MLFDQNELDNLVYDILADCREVDPPLDRNEISQHVIDHLSDHMHKFVWAALERLVREGRVVDDRAEGRSAGFRYSLPPVGAHN